jgi:hypothetical protein
MPIYIYSSFADIFVALSVFDVFTKLTCKYYLPVKKCASSFIYVVGEVILHRLWLV